MNKRIKWGIIILIGAGLAGLGIYQFTPHENEELTAADALPKENKQRTLKVNAQVIKPHLLTDEILVTGRLVPDEEVSLSFETSGKITDIFFTEGTLVKRAQSQVEQQKNEYRIEKRSWWNYFRLNGNYAFGRFNTLSESSETLVDWYQSTSTGTRHTFNLGASVSIGLGDLFNRPLKLKNYRYNIEQLQYTQDEVMEERKLKVLEAYNAVTEQLATIKAKAETAALYNAQMKISENDFIQGKINIISLSLERARRTGAHTKENEMILTLP